MLRKQLKARSSSKDLAVGKLQPPISRFHRGPGQTDLNDSPKRETASSPSANLQCRRKAVGNCFAEKGCRADFSMLLRCLFHPAFLARQHPGTFTKEAHRKLRDGRVEPKTKLWSLFWTTNSHRAVPKVHKVHCWQANPQVGTPQ